MCQSRANTEAEVSALGYLCLPEVEEVSLLSQLQCPLFLYKTWGRQVISATGWISGILAGAVLIGQRPALFGY